MHLHRLPHPGPGAVTVSVLPADVVCLGVNSEPGSWGLGRIHTRDLQGLYEPGLYQ